MCAFSFKHSYELDPMLKTQVTFFGLSAFTKICWAVTWNSIAVIEAPALGDQIEKRFTCYAIRSTSISPFYKKRIG